jgi:multidrug efflux pump subunit AcrB/ABC-type multidrug transport system ATPase subunit
VNLPTFAIKRPVTTVMFFIALGVLGAISYTTLPVQLIPNYIYPKMFVVAGYPGASPEKVEEDLIERLEAEIATLEDIEEIEAQSNQNYGMITVSYKLGTDLNYAYLKLEQKANGLIGILPETATLSVERFDTSAFSNFVMQLNVAGPGGLPYVRRLAEEKIRPRLESVNGVVSVQVFGGQQLAVQVTLDENRLRAYGLSPTMVLATLNGFHQRREFVGEVEVDGRRQFAMVEGRFTTLQEIRDLPLNSGTGLVFLRDVARVEEAPDRQTQVSRVEGHPTVSILIQKDEQSNLIKVARLLRQEIAEINEELAAPGVRVTTSFDAAEMIEKDIDRVKKLALSGGLLALLVLLMFLKRPGPVLVVTLAIPVSLLLTFNLMAAAGLAIDVLTLIGLTLSIGLLVDNAIVVLESITRHRERGLSRMEAAITGSSEVFKAIIVGTATTVVVFTPLLWVKTEFTELYNDFALAIIFPLLISLLVALTLIPMLASRLGRREDRADGPPFDPSGDRKRPKRYLQLYTLLLKQCARHQVLTTVTFFAVLVLTVLITTPIILYLYGTNQPPDSRIEMKLEMPEGADLESTLAVTAQLEAMTLDLPDRKETRATVREGEAFVTVELLPQDERTSDHSLGAIRNRLMDRTEAINGATVLFDRSQFQSAAGDDDGGGGAAMLGLSPAVETVVLTGEEMPRLVDLANEVKYRLDQIDGVESRTIRMDMEDATPEVRLEARYQDLASWGLSMRQVMALLWMARREGDKVTYPYRDQQDNEMDILVRLGEEGEWSFSDLRELSIPTPTGEFVRVQELMNFRQEAGLPSLKRHQGTHRIRVFYGYEDEVLDTQSRLDEMRLSVDELLLSIPLPRGYTLTAEREDEEENVWKFMLYVALILVYMILAASFESFTHPLLILFANPMAVVGVLILLALTGVGMGPMVFLSLLVLLGIVVNNGILLIDYARHLVRNRGFRPERAIIASGRARFRPVMMTATTTLAGMLPLAMRMGGENEIWPPFAIAVIGGLAASTLGTLLLIPMGFLSFRFIGKWLRDTLGLPWVLASSLLTAAVVWGLYFQLGWVDSDVWRIIYLLPIWFACLGLVRFGLWLARGKQRREVFAADQPLTIAVRELKKIYGEDGPFLRGWKQNARWLKHARDRGRPLDTRRQLAGELIWKIPLLALLFYLLSYFENRFWLFVFIGVTWYFVRDFLVTMTSLWRMRRGAEPEPGTPTVFSRSRWLNLLFGVTLAVLALVQAHVACELKYGFTITITVLLALATLTLRTGARLRRGELDTEGRGGNIFKRLRRSWYRLVAAIPLVGREKDRVAALRGLSLDIGSGMFGLLGPNGAGKTTLMRVICNIYEQSRGTVAINDRDPRENRDAVQSLVGYLPQNFGVYENFTAWELLNYYALLNEIYDPAEREKLVTGVLKRVALFERKDEKLKGYSGGMKQRVGIATALLHLPRIIVVDEPTAGLDPKERIRFRNLLAELAKERIVIFSTHIVEDISGTCNRVAVVDKGRVIFDGTVEEMIDRTRGKVFEAVTEEQQLPELSKRLKVVTHIGEGFDRIRLRFLADGPPEGLAAEEAEPNLEDAYLYLRGGTAPV